MNPQMMAQMAQLLQGSGVSPGNAQMAGMKPNLPQQQTPGQIGQMGTDPISPVQPPLNLAGQQPQAGGLAAGLQGLGKSMNQYTNPTNGAYWNGSPDSNSQSQSQSMGANPYQQASGGGYNPYSGGGQSDWSGGLFNMFGGQ